jgi:hypothetical protein
MRTYNQALSSFITTNSAPIYELLGISEKSVGQGHLGKMLQNLMGEQLETQFEFQGRFDAGTLSELRMISPAKRVAKKLSIHEHAEIGLVQNRSMDKVAELRKNDHSSLAAHLATWRTARMRSEMRKLAEASRDVEFKTRRLVANINRFRLDPSAENRFGVIQAVKGLNKSLLSIHYRARSAGSWAIRAGFSPKAAAKALDHLYMKKMTRLGNSLVKLDEWLNTKGIKASMGAGVRRRHDIIVDELLQAHGAVNRKTPKARYPEDMTTLPGLEHG